MSHLSWPCSRTRTATTTSNTRWDPTVQVTCHSATLSYLRKLHYQCWWYLSNSNVWEVWFKCQAQYKCNCYRDPHHSNHRWFPSPRCDHAPRCELCTSGTVRKIHRIPGVRIPKTERGIFARYGKHTGKCQTTVCLRYAAHGRVDILRLMRERRP